MQGQKAVNSKYPESVNTDALLIYDGDCAFCKQSLKWALGKLPEFCRYAAYQKLDFTSFGLVIEDVKSQVWLIEGNRKYGGHRAVSWLFRQQNHLGWRTLGWLIDFFSPISALVYRWVANNRHRLPGGTAECVIDDRP
jgi:predicted DCC family thiol-disulfide oxidoreductase YuxK